MAIACPIDLDTQKLRGEIQSIYSRVAVDPAGEFHFHRGPEYAAEFLNYDRAALAELPAQSTASFAGVANPHRMGPIGEAKVVIDIGCGAGMDVLLAARSVGPRGRAIGVDMTQTMLEKASSSARAAGLRNVEVRMGDAMLLPVDNESADVVISNGVLNPGANRGARSSLRSARWREDPCSGGRLLAPRASHQQRNAQARRFAGTDRRRGRSSCRRRQGAVALMN